MVKLLYPYCRKDGAVPTLKSMMQRKPVVGEVLLERIPMEDIPIGAEEATNWVHERYIHKVKRHYILVLYFLHFFKIFGIIHQSNN